MAKITSLSTVVTLFVTSSIGLFAAAKLILEKITYWTNEAKGLSTASSCDLNPLVGCGNVINSPQASLVGTIPNPLWGVIGWSIVWAFTLFMLTGGTLRKIHWLTLQAGVTGALVLVTYLQYVSLYQLNVLCPYCLVTWAVTIVAFWATTARNLKVYKNNTRASIVYNWAIVWPFLHIIFICALILAKFGLAVFA